MEIRNYDRIQIFVLPDNAECRLSGENPMNMDNCPLMHNWCCPEICPFYTEDIKE